MFDIVVIVFCSNTPTEIWKNVISSMQRRTMFEVNYCEALVPAFGGPDIVTTPAIHAETCTIPSHISIETPRSGSLPNLRWSEALDSRHKGVHGGLCAYFFQQSLKRTSNFHLQEFERLRPAGENCVAHSTATTVSTKPLVCFPSASLRGSVVASHLPAESDPDSVGSERSVVLLPESSLLGK